MSVSAVSTTSASPQGTTRGGPMKSLIDGINSGDLTSAKTAFDTLQKNRPGATASSGTTSQRDQDIAAIGKALDSGDADAAKQALAKLRDDRENAGAAQDTQRHHGHRTQARGDASLTYSAAATATPTAAPGSTIDVSA